MVYAPLSAMLLSVAFFYLSSQDQAFGGIFRRFFMYSGFVMALLSFGLSITSSSEIMVSAGMYILVLLLFLFTGIDWLFMAVKKWLDLRK